MHLLANFGPPDGVAIAVTVFLLLGSFLVWFGCEEGFKEAMAIFGIILLLFLGVAAAVCVGVLVSDAFK